MHRAVRSRRDPCKDPQGHFESAWAVRVPGYHKTVHDYLIFASDLRPRPGFRRETLYMKGATHKASVRAVLPDTPVDYQKNLFAQPHLMPMQQPFIEYQVKYENDDDCIRRITAAVGLITNLDLPPFAPSAEEFDRWLNRLSPNRAPYVIVPRPYAAFVDAYEDAA